MACNERKVGIDIQIPTDKIQKLHKRFLSETEQSELKIENDTAKLTIAWAAKEALYKIIGIEAVDFANQLRIFPFEVHKTGKLNAEHVPTETKFELNYILNDDFTLVYCLA